MDQVKLLSRISGGLGCDLVNQTTEFTARLGRIYVIIPDEANSRILNMTEERPPNAPSSVKTTAVVTGGTYKSVQRVDYITLAGTGGTATIVCNGVTKTATFATDLTVTASNFVTANATDYLASGVVLTSLLNVLIFTAVLAGTDFTGASSCT